jgi:hypothetical protein
MQNKVASLLLMYLAFCLPSRAQDVRGSISGFVTDPSGGAVAGARVTITNTETNVSQQTETGSGGAYRVLYLLPGKYKVAVEAPGFRRLVREGIELRVSEHLTVDLTLEVGALQETVNVVAEAPLLEVSTATTGQVIDRRRISDLPLADGNPLTLVQLAPGVVVTGGYTSLSALSNSGPSNFEANGSPGGNEFTLDGAPNTADRQTQGAARVGLQPPTEAVEEFKVVTAGFDAQIGRTAGASVDVSIRSGTNQLRGSLYEFVRNDALAANSFFFNREGRPKQPRRFNRYGGTVGGPVWLPKLYQGRDRTFFFVSYERIRTITPDLETLTVPTEDYRKGDFSSLLNQTPPLYVYDPYSARREGGRIVREPIRCGARLNVICPDRINAIAKNYLSFLPLPNTNLGSPTGNFIGNGPGDNRYYVFITRLDHVFNERHRTFFRLSQNWRTEIDENSAGRVNGVRINGRLGHRGNLGAVVDHVFIPGPSTVLNLRASATRFKQDRVSLASLDYDVRNMGFSEATTRLFSANTLPQINITNYSSPVEQHGYLNSNPNYIFQSALTKMLAKNAIRVGYDFRVYQENRIPETYKAGQYNFTNLFTRATDQNPSLPFEQVQAQSLASFLLGLPSGGNYPLLADRAATMRYNALFIQDDWKVTSRLTLNFGIRYEIDSGTTERYNRLLRDFDAVSLSPADAAVRVNYERNPIPEIPVDQFRLRGGVLFASPSNRPAYQADRNNIQPRFGAALQLTSRTALRLGWGRFMVPFVMDGLNQNGFSSNTPLVASPDLGLTFTASLTDPFPNGLLPVSAKDMVSLLGQSPGSIVPVVRRNGLVDRWQVSLQRQVRAHWLVELAYMGNRGFDLTTTNQANPVPRQYQSTLPVRDQALINFLDAPVTNPFRGVAAFEGTALYTNSVISRSQLLRPYPHFSTFTVERYDGRSSYHAGQIRVERRFSSGFTFQGAYSYSKYLEQVQLLNETDSTYEKRLADVDSPHRLALSGIWELPFGRNRRFGSQWRGLLNHLLGGYQIQGIYQYQSGFPLTIGNVYFSGDLSRLKPKVSSRTIGALGTSNILDNVFGIDIRETGFYFTDDAVRTGGALDYAKQRNDPRIQLSNNIRTLPSRVANFRGDDISLLDISLIKNIHITERVRLQFRAEALNACNTPHFSAPILNPRDPNFGRVTSTNSPTLPREFQLALRLLF